MHSIGYVYWGIAGSMTLSAGWIRATITPDLVNVAGSMTTSIIIFTAIWFVGTWLIQKIRPPPPIPDTQEEHQQ